MGAQVVGISTDHHLALAAWQKDQGSKQMLLSDFRRQMLPTYGAMQTDEQSPVYRYAKRAYFIVDKKMSKNDVSKIITAAGFKNKFSASGDKAVKSFHAAFASGDKSVACCSKDKV